MGRRRRRDALAIVVIALVSGLLFASPAFDPVHGLSLDVLTALRWHAFGPRHAAADAPTVVVAIDEESYDAAPFRGSPTITWTREIGRVLTALVDGGAAVVGFDVVFPSSIEESVIPFGDEPVGARLRGFDRDFLRALHAAAAADRLVLGEVRHREAPLRPTAGQRIAVGQQRNIRSLNVLGDADDVVRRLPLAFEADGRMLPSMALELAARALRATPEIAADGTTTLAGYRVAGTLPHTLTLNFDGGAEDIPTHSLADLRECVERGDRDYFRRHFEGKVVLIGTLLDTEDRKATSKRFATGRERARAPRCALPLPAVAAEVGRRTVSGVYVHATAVDNLIRREAVREPGRAATAALAVALAALAATAARLFAPGGAMLAFIAIAGAYGTGALLGFRHALALPLVEPWLAGLAAVAAMLGWRFVVADRQERLLRRSFGLYLSPRVIDRLVESESLPALGGEMREVSVLFSDIAGFSTFAETMAPAELVALMNEYLSAMTDVIEECGGYVDKYIGDSIVAVFGAPVFDADHAVSAVRAALRCRARLEELNRSAGAFGGRRVGQRIGINSGPALVGNIGSRRRFNYTVMSDAVNLASRLEGANKYFDTTVLVSEATVALTGAAFAWREIDAIRVKGREQALKVFEPGAEAGALTPEQAARDAGYAEGLGAWRARDFAAAAQCFARIAAADPPAARFERRARELAARPPAADWVPVNTLEGK